MVKQNKHPKGYWTLERCKAICLACSKIKDIPKDCRGTIYAKGWQSECFAHIKIYDWTLERCKEEAKKHTRKHDIPSKCLSTIKANHWDKICLSHLTTKHNYWTLERCKAEASKYQNRQQLVKNNAGCYHAIYRNGWWSECCEHMGYQQTYKIPSMEECKRIAQKYRTRAEFQKSEYGWLYRRAYNNGFLDELCEHMDKLHNLTERCIYAITFPDGYAYVGLSCNMMRRFGNHKRGNSPIHQHMIDTGLEPTITMVHDYMPAIEAKHLEGTYIQQYADQGYMMLNKNVGGGQMGCADSGHSKEEVFREIKRKKYKTLKAFREGSAGYYESAYRSDYWHEVREMLKVLCVSHHWTREEVLELARNCNTYREFSTKHKRAYEWANKNHIIDEIKQFLPSRALKKRYSDEDIRAAAIQCVTRSEFCNRFTGEYYAAYHRGHEYYEDVCSHMQKYKYVKKINQFTN